MKNFNLPIVKESIKPQVSHHWKFLKSYKNSIYRYLGYNIDHSINLKKLPEDSTKMILTVFFFSLSFIILVSLSINIYSNFNNKTSIKLFQKDNIYEEVEEYILSQSLEYIDHDIFLRSSTEYFKLDVD